MGKRLTTEEWIEKAEVRHGDKYDYNKSIYVHSHSKITITCKMHGDFTLQAGKHLLGCGCQKCGIERLKESLSKNLEQFIQEARERHGNFYDYNLTAYHGSLKKIKILCPIHGLFEQRASDHLKKGCKNCSYELYASRKAKTRDQFVEKASEVHKGIYDYSKCIYRDSREKVIIICSKHGEFEQRASSHLTGSGCPLCTDSKSQNRLFEIIKNLFNGHNILSNYKHPNLRFEDSGCKMELDMFIPELNLAIEYQGEVHYKPIFGKLALDGIKKRDKEKKRACKNSGIRLVCVPYTYDISKIDKLLKEQNDKRTT